SKEHDSIDTIEHLTVQFKRKGSINHAYLRPSREDLSVLSSFQVRISRQRTHLLLQIIKEDHFVTTTRDQAIIRRSVISYMDIHRTTIDLRNLSLMDSKVIINSKDNNNMGILVPIRHTETIKKGNVWQLIL
ncbi:hypothetical protein H5410_031461, partial [Solanum commersonii]